MSENFNYLNAFLISVFVSLFFFTGISFYILIYANKGSFYTLPILPILILGAIAGFIHGSTMWLILALTKSDSIVSILTASVFATVILSMVVVGFIIYLDHATDSVSLGRTIINSLNSISVLGKIFFQALSYLLVPAILIGLTNHLVLFFFRRN